MSEYNHIRWMCHSQTNVHSGFLQAAYFELIIITSGWCAFCFVCTEHSVSHGIYVCKTPLFYPQRDAVTRFIVKPRYTRRVLRQCAKAVVELNHLANIVFVLVFVIKFAVLLCCNSPYTDYMCIEHAWRLCILRRDCIH